MSFAHLHRHSEPCLLAERITTNGYPSGSLHRRVLEEKLGRPLKPGHETHHICENRGCIEPTHLEEKDMVLHRGDHSRKQRGKKRGPLKLSQEEHARRSAAGKELIHHAASKAYTKTSRSEAQKRRYASMTPERRAEIGAAISRARQGGGA